MTVGNGRLASAIAAMMLGMTAPQGTNSMGHGAVGTGEPLNIAGARVVGDDVMDRLRGGFTTPDGLVLSFGIERVVYINGELASSTRLNVTELGNLVGGSADMAAMLPLGATVGLIQSGPNNSFVGGAMNSGSFATVIQNSLDNQHVQAITTIDAQVNSLDLMRANRFGESLRDALTFGR